MNVYHSFTRQSWNGDCSVAVLSHRVNLLTRGAYLGNNRVSVSSIRTSLLAAIDVDLVYFSELFVSWNAMENVIKAVHVIPIHACVQPPLHLMRLNKSCSW